MRESYRTMRFAVFCCGLFSCLMLNAQQTDTAGSVLWKLFADEEAYQLRDNPENATVRGFRQYDSLLTDLSSDAMFRRQQHDSLLLKKLSAIDRGVLEPADQLNYDLFRRQVIRRMQNHRFPDHWLPVSQLWGPQVALRSMVSQTSFTKINDYRHYLQRMKRIPRYLRQVTLLMRNGLANGWMLPAAPLRGVANQIRSNYPDSLESNPFYLPFVQFQIDLTDNQEQHLRMMAAKIVEDSLNPAFHAFADFFAEEYYPNCLKATGIWQVPGGKQYYQNRVAHYTTTDMTAAQIHQTGLAEVQRIRQEMQETILQTGFEGSFAQFIEFLRSDPQFYHRSAEALLTGYRDICKRIDPELVKLFGRIPRMPYGVKEIPAYQAPTTYTAYYSPPAEDGSRAGYFFANTYRLETRPIYEMEALTVHEAVPGHHFQIALALELDNLPAFRRRGSFTAFVEGWALYAESLGEALGLYKDPYSRFGQLTYEMWRACRLVVDTGMHSQRWTRRQAIDYMAENSAKTLHDIENEIDRYIVWPGQALAYKIGELKIKELREMAETQLGVHFDVRIFHDRLLENGAIPLDVLEKIMTNYVQKEVKEDKRR